MQRNCSDPKYIFRDFVNLRGCYDEFGGSPHNSTFARAVSLCLNDYCSNPLPQIRGCGKLTEPTELIFDIREEPCFIRPYVYFNNAAVCDDVRDDINSDMAGPGVFSSYIIQLYLSLFMHFILRMSSFLSFREAVRGLVRGILKRKAPAAAERLVNFFYRHLAILKHTLVEFQDAQCFFMFASQIATIYSLNKPEASQSYTMRSAVENIMASCFISTIGILPVVINMRTLRLVGECSAWTISLSIVTVCLSETALYKTKRISPTSHMSKVEYSRWPDSCGGHPPPLIYCGISVGDSVAFDWPSTFLRVSNPVCLVVFTTTILLWTRRRVIESKYAKEFAPFSIGKMATILLTRLPAKLGKMAALYDDGGRVFQIVIFEAILGYIALQSIVIFNIFNNLVNWGDWSFGQAIAITLWLPVVSKYFYWLSFGTASYSKVRIPSPYKIIKSVENDSAAIPVEDVGPHA